MTANDKPDFPTLADLLSLETAVWQALVDGDAEADRRLLLPEFFGVYSSGFSDRDGHAGQLADGPTIRSFAISDARLTPAGDDHAMLSYRARFCRAGQAVEEEVYVSSLWQRTADGWRNLFSQDTDRRH